MVTHNRIKSDEAEGYGRFVAFHSIELIRAAAAKDEADRCTCGACAANALFLKVVLAAHSAVIRYVQDDRNALDKLVADATETSKMMGLDL